MCVELKPASVASSTIGVSVESSTFPELIRYSVESLGGDVVKLLRDAFHVDILWAQNGRLPEYFMLVGGLLTK